MPRQATPGLAFPLVGGGRFDLADETGERGTVVVVYRGLHCPVCATYLKAFEALAGDFAERGYGTVAVSVDGAERAAAMKEKAGAEKLRIGYDLSLKTAREWGLYISASRGTSSLGIGEPALFAEPGLFVVRADRTLFCSSVQTMPAARPHFDELMRSLDFSDKNGFAGRGEYDGPV